MIKIEASVIFVLGTLTLMVFVFFLILIMIEYRRRQVRHVTEKLKMEHQYESEVLQTRLEVQEQSFKYVSEEIHDNISQVLSLAKLKLYRTTEIVIDERLKESLESSTELVGNALKDLRNLSHVLNGGLVSKLSLRESIEKELSYARDVKDVNSALTFSGDTYELSPEKKLMVFRIVQEAIHNAIKHGDATEINVNLDYRPADLCITIADNGKGFDLEQMENSKGLGLHNMRVRAKLLGKISVDSASGRGTKITLNIDSHETKTAGSPG